MISSTVIKHFKNFPDPCLVLAVLPRPDKIPGWWSEDVRLADLWQEVFKSIRNQSHQASALNPGQLALLHPCPLHPTQWCRMSLTPVSSDTQRERRNNREQPSDDESKLHNNIQLLHASGLLVLLCWYVFTFSGNMMAGMLTVGLCWLRLNTTCGVARLNRLYPVMGVL